MIDARSVCCFIVIECEKKTGTGRGTLWSIGVWANQQFVFILQWLATIQNWKPTKIGWKRNNSLSDGVVATADSRNLNREINFDILLIPINSYYTGTLCYDKFVGTFSRMKTTTTTAARAEYEKNADRRRVNCYLYRQWRRLITDLYYLVYSLFSSFCIKLRINNTIKMKTARISSKKKIQWRRRRRQKTGFICFAQW